MKTTLYLSAMILLNLNSFKAASFNSKDRTVYNDSTIVNHILDGSIKEWPADKFKPDDETGTRYAIDNNAGNLFLAISIPEFRTQFKMMRNGMSMYIDLKGKKKESRGIDFPEKNEAIDLNSQEFSGNRTIRQGENQVITEQQKKTIIKNMRMRMALTLANMKVFGFTENGLDDQQLLLPGSANIAFSWDSSDVMHIEYRIPLSILGDKESLNQKEISIGWKIHAYEKLKSDNSENSAENTNRGEGFGAGRSQGYYGGMSSDRYDQGGNKMMEDQKFWTKYTINIPTEKKAF